MTAKEYSSPTLRAALMVSSEDQLRSMPRPQLMSLFSLIAQRLERPGQPPTLAELQGIKALVTEHLWHPALNDVMPLKDSEP